MTSIRELIEVEPQDAFDRELTPEGWERPVNRCEFTGDGWWIGYGERNLGPASWLKQRFVSVGRSLTVYSPEGDG